MAEKNLSGYWRHGMDGLPSYPMTSVQPRLWKWADVRESPPRAGEAISLEQSERRAVRLINPGLDRERAFATHTLQISFQYVKPGENARAHRRINRSSSDGAIFFSMSDAPALKALELYREEC